MELEEAKKIIDRLPKGRTIFYYFKDRYALELVKWFAGQGKTIAQVKGSQFGKLLSKPLFKSLTARLGSGVLTEFDAMSVWPLDHEAYLLSLGTWGHGPKRWRGYYQTSRRGTNLVLQLNFSTKHDEPYSELIKPDKKHPFEYAEHPINKRGRHTLAWARLDIETGTGEALIEEIQSDWIRLALRRQIMVEDAARRAAGRDTRHNSEMQWVRRRLEQDGVRGSEKELEQYVTEVLDPHMALWNEAILFAAIWFLREELGIHRIFYHTFETGNWLKGLSSFDEQPPKSLYTKLPKRFCFQETDVGPRFIKPKRKRHPKKDDGKRPFRFFLLTV